MSERLTRAQNPNAQYWLYQQQHGQPAVPQRHILPQEPYTSPSHTTSPIALQHAPIVFVVGGTPGIRVADALQENYQGLLHADEPVGLPEPIGVKITFRIQVRLPPAASLSLCMGSSGYQVIGYPKFEKQKYIRAVADNSPITYGRLARRAAEAISDFIQVSHRGRHSIVWGS